MKKWFAQSSHSLQLWVSELNPILLDFKGKESRDNSLESIYTQKERDGERVFLMKALCMTEQIKEKTKHFYINLRMTFEKKERLR